MKPETLARIQNEHPAGDLQWLSGGVDRVLRDDERATALPLMRKQIEFWTETWPELLAYIRDLERVRDAAQEDSIWPQNAKTRAALAALAPVGNTPGIPDSSVGDGRTA